MSEATKEQRVSAAQRLFGDGWETCIDAREFVESGRCDGYEWRVTLAMLAQAIADAEQRGREAERNGVESHLRKWIDEERDDSERQIALRDVLEEIEQLNHVDASLRAALDEGERSPVVVGKIGEEG
jgi:hypothetical protein